MNNPRYLKVFTSSSRRCFILISIWKPSGLFFIIFVLSGQIFAMYLVHVMSILVTMSPAFPSSSALIKMSYVKRKLMTINLPMPILPSWSTNASLVLLSRTIFRALEILSLSNHDSSSKPVSGAPNSVKSLLEIQKVMMQFLLNITKTSPCNEDPLTPHFYIVKLGFTGVYIISLILL